MKELLERIQSWFLSVTGIMSATDEEAIVTALLLIVANPDKRLSDSSRILSRPLEDQNDTVLLRVEGTA